VTTPWAQVAAKAFENSSECQYQLDKKLAASAETRPNLLERRNVTSFDSHRKTDSRVDKAEQRAEQGEHRPDLRMLVTLRRYIPADCRSLDAHLLGVV
jgi:hypothetical protein